MSDIWLLYCCVFGALGTYFVGKYVAASKRLSEHHAAMRRRGIDPEGE